jgi:hypothetical protein
MQKNPTFAENHAITKQEIPADHYVSNTPFTRNAKENQMVKKNINFKTDCKVRFQKNVDQL